MSLVDTTTLLRVADRAAYQYEQLKITLSAISQVGLGYYWQTVTATDDPDVEIPTLADYKRVDDDWLAGYVAKNGTLLGYIIGGMEAHFNIRDPITNLPLQAGGWDGYLYTKNKRVSQYFAELFYACRGYYMLAVDVFSEGVDTLATAQVIAGPAVLFTDGISYGNGSNLNPANGTYFAATQLRAVVTTMGGVNLDLRLSVKDVNNNPTTIDVTIPGGSIPGAVVNIGTSSDRFLDVTGIILKPAGSAGTLGDTITVKNLKERQIQL
jgi:hypothetical protein